MKLLILNLGIKGTWAGGTPYIPIDLEASKAKGEEVLNWEDAYSVKNPDYIRFDIRLGFKINMKRISQEWAVDLQNVTNSQNIFSRYYNHFTQSIGQSYQMGFMPMFLYRIMS